MSTPADLGQPLVVAVGGELGNVYSGHRNMWVRGLSCASGSVFLEEQLHAVRGSEIEELLPLEELGLLCVRASHGVFFVWLDGSGDETVVKTVSKHVYSHGMHWDEGESTLSVSFYGTNNLPSHVQRWLLGLGDPIDLGHELEYQGPTGTAANDVDALSGEHEDGAG